MKKLIESSKSSEEIVQNLTEKKTKKDVEQIVVAQGLGHNEYEWDDGNVASPPTIEVYTDERTFENIVGDLESSGITISDFNYEEANYGGEPFGWIRVALHLSEAVDKIQSEEDVLNFVSGFEADIIDYYKDNDLHKMGGNGAIQAVNYILDKNNMEATTDAMDKIIDQINWSSSYMY